jgi:hypothetical protein
MESANRRSLDLVTFRCERSRSAPDDSLLRSLRQDRAGFAGLQGAILFVMPILFVRVGFTTHHTTASWAIGGIRIVAEELPGLLKSGVFGFGAVRGEEHFSLAVSVLEGNDVPDLDGNNKRRDEVEHAVAVRDSVGVDVTLVSAGGVVAASGFDLHAEDVSMMLDGDVVGRGVSPGTDDGEALLGGARHEQKFGPFALLFEVVEDVGGVVGHEVLKSHPVARSGNRATPAREQREFWGPWRVATGKKQKTHPNRDKNVAIRMWHPRQ